MVNNGIEKATGADRAPGIATRPVWLCAALAAVLMSLRSLFVGSSGDDLSQRLMLDDHDRGYKQHA